MATSPIALFSRVPRLDVQAPGGETFVFDASESEQHNVVADWTAEPLESGVQLSDHRVIRQRELPMTVVVSSAEQGGFIRDRHIQAWERLRRYVTADPPLLFELTTTLETLDNCVLASVGVPYIPANGNALVASLVLRQLEFSQTDVAANLADAAVDLGQGEVDLGSQGVA